MGVPFTDIKRLSIDNVSRASPKSANSSGFYDLENYVSSCLAMLHSNMSRNGRWRAGLRLHRHSCFRIRL